MLAMIKASAHHHDVLLDGIGVAQDVAQVVQIARIAHRNQHVARPHAHGAAAEFLVAIHAELVEAFGLSLAFACNAVFGIREDDEEQQR